MENITLPPFQALNDDLWVEPISTPAPRKSTKKATSKLSPELQSAVDMSKKVGIDMFQQVEHPVAHFKMSFGAAYKTLHTQYIWSQARIEKWAMTEKFAVDNRKRNAELSYGR